MERAAAHAVSLEVRETNTGCVRERVCVCERERGVCVCVRERERAATNAVSLEVNPEP